MTRMPEWQKYPAGTYAVAGECKGCGRDLPADGWEDVRVWCSHACRSVTVQRNARADARDGRLDRFIAQHTVKQLMGPFAV